jgi:hypothetical protein
MLYVQPTPVIPYLKRMHFDATASSAVSSDIEHEKKLFYKRQTKGKKKAMSHENTESAH